MKKITLLAILLTLGVVTAQASNLTINVMEKYGTTYLITLNNQTTYQSRNDITMNQINGGEHHVYIVQQQEITRRTGRFGRLETFIQEEVMFDGFVSIPHNSDVLASLNYQNLVITQVIQNTPPRRRGRGRAYGNGPRNHYPIAQPMANPQFNSLLQTLQNEAFESNKLALLKPALRQNYFSANQILRLMKTFSFDSKKLQVAKLAYANTLDKQNYFIVNNGLTFSSNKRALAQFIQQSTL